MVDIIWVHVFIAGLVEHYQMRSFNTIKGLYQQNDTLNFECNEKSPWPNVDRVAHAHVLTIKHGVNSEDTTFQPHYPLEPCILCLNSIDPSNPWLFSIAFTSSSHLFTFTCNPSDST